MPENGLNQRVRLEIVCFKTWIWRIVFNHCTEYDVLRHICHVLIFAKDTGHAFCIKVKSHPHFWRWLFTIYGTPTRIRTWDLRLSLPLRISPPCLIASSWSGLSLHRIQRIAELRCQPSSLYTFPSFLVGLARDCHSAFEQWRFPRIWLVLLLRFPPRHSNWRPLLYPAELLARI